MLCQARPASGGRGELVSSWVAGPHSPGSHQDSGPGGWATPNHTLAARPPPGPQAPSPRPRCLDGAQLQPHACGQESGAAGPFGARSPWGGSAWRMPSAGQLPRRSLPRDGRRPHVAHPRSPACGAAPCPAASVPSWRGRSPALCPPQALKYSFQTHDRLCFVMEYANGGEVGLCGPALALPPRGPSAAQGQCSRSVAGAGGRPLAAAQAARPAAVLPPVAGAGVPRGPGSLLRRRDRVGPGLPALGEERGLPRPQGGRPGRGPRAAGWGPG